MLLCMLCHALHAAAVAELWNARWNLTVGNVLRCIIYEPIMECEMHQINFFSLLLHCEVSNAYLVWLVKGLRKPVARCSVPCSSLSPLQCGW